MKSLNSLFFVLVSLLVCACGQNYESKKIISGRFKIVYDELIASESIEVDLVTSAANSNDKDFEGVGVSGVWSYEGEQYPVVIIFEENDSGWSLLSVGFEDYDALSDTDKGKFTKTLDDILLKAAK